MNVFIIGAGFTKAVFPNAPLNSQLLEALARKDSDSAARALWDRYKTKDIEIALTKLDADIAQAGSGAGQNPAELRRRIECELVNFFDSGSKLRASEDLLTELPWLAQFIDEAFRRGDVAISLNYDCVLEGALDVRGKWSPKGGYGSITLETLYGKCPPTQITILKIHGSTSFKIDQDSAGVDLIGFVFNPLFFPRSAKSMGFDYGRGAAIPYVIAPSYVKIPCYDITRLMLEALEATTKAEKLIVIGSSLRPEDAFLTVLLANFLRKNSGKKIIVLGPEAQETKDRLNKYWGDDLILPIPKALGKPVVDDLINLLAKSD